MIVFSAYVSQQNIVQVHQIQEINFCLNSKSAERKEFQPRFFYLVKIFFKNEDRASLVIQ